MDIYLDGAFADNCLLLKEDAGWIHAWRRYFDGATRFDGKRWEVKPFKFCEITAGMFYQYYLSFVD